MTTWSLHTFSLLRAAQIPPLLQSPFADVLDTSLGNITTAVSAKNQQVGAELQAIVGGGKDAGVLQRASDQCRLLTASSAVRISGQLDEGDDNAPPEIADRVRDILRGGVAAVAPRSLEVGGAAARVRPRATELLPARGPGGFSDLVHGDFGGLAGGEPGNILDRAVRELLELDLKNEKLSAERIARLAQELVEVVRTHQKILVACLSPVQQERLGRIARENHIPKETAEIEYLANVCLFKVLRDYYSLQQANYLPKKTANGFILLTANGSVVGSPPSAPDAGRTIHYARMPSREMRLQTGIYRGRLQKDIEAGHGFHSESLNTSPIVEIALIPPDKAGLFTEVFARASEGMSEVRNSVIIEK